MEVIDVKQIAGFLEKYPINSCFEAKLQKYPLPNRLKLKVMNKQKIVDLAERINRLKCLKPERAGGQEMFVPFSWKKWELSLFIWFFLYYCHVFEGDPSKLEDKDFQFFCLIFIARTPLRLKHELKSLLQFQNDKKLVWTEEEDIILKKVVESYLQVDHFEWKSVSYQFFVESDCKYFRSYSQCRQRWNNHFDLSIKKEKWSIEEDLLLMRTVEEQGKKWSSITKIFKGSRTEHMVKNRYNSLMRKWKVTYWKKTDAHIHQKIIQKLLKVKEKQQVKLTSVSKADNEGQFEHFEEAEFSPAANNFKEDISNTYLKNVESYPSSLLSPRHFDMKEEEFLHDEHDIEFQEESEKMEQDNLDILSRRESDWKQNALNFFND